MEYRIERNIERSIIDTIADPQTGLLVIGGWNGFSVEKSFSKAIAHIPSICINVLEPVFIKKEIGNYIYLKNYIVQIRIFADDDGQRLDLVDYLLNEIEKGIDYYIYTVSNGIISEKTKTGRININRIRSSRKELRNTENLIKADKFRHLIELEVRVTT